MLYILALGFLLGVIAVTLVLTCRYMGHYEEAIFRVGLAIYAFSIFTIGVVIFSISPGSNFGF